MAINSQRMSGYAMVYAMLLILLISTFFSSMFLIEEIEMSLLQNHRDRLEVRRNIGSGINKYLASFKVNENASMHLFPNSDATVKIESRTWGVDQLLLVRSSKNRARDSAMVFLASSFADTTNGILHLLDKGRPLEISRSTFFQGKVWLPKAGLSRPSFRGAGYKPRSRVDGTINVSSAHHRINLNSMASRINSFISGLENASRVQESIEKYDTIIQSFFDPLVILDLPDSLVLDGGQFLSGQVVVRSPGHIKLTSNCFLDKVIVIGKEVTVEEGFSGSVQIIASSGITINKNVHLKYPSTLTLIPYDEPLSDQEIIIRSDSQVNGSVWDLSRKVNSTVTIEENAQVNGLVCALNRFFLEGEVVGLAEVGEFVVNTGGFIQVGEIRGGIIRSGGDDISFGTYINNSKPKISLWLN